MIPRLVYGMLRGRLLDPVLVSRDERAFVSHLSNSLSPEALAMMLYPKLLTFASTDVNTPMGASACRPRGAVCCRVVSACVLLCAGVLLCSASAF